MMIGNEITQQIIKELAREKMLHLSSLLNHRHGIEAILDISQSEDKYSVILFDEDLEGNVILRFQTKQLFSLNTVAVAEHISRTFVSQCLYERKQNVNFELEDLDGLLTDVELQSELEEVQKFFFTYYEGLEYDLIFLVFRLAGEKLSHITSVLNFRYGIESIPLVNVSNVSFSVLLEVIEEKADIKFFDLLQCDVEKEVSNLRKIFMWKLAS